MDQRMVSVFLEKTTGTFVRDNKVELWFLLECQAMCTIGQFWLFIPYVNFRPANFKSGPSLVLFCSLELLNLKMQQPTTNFRCESFFYDARLGKKNAHDIT